MTFDQTLWLAWLTWPLCFAIFFIAVCRLNAMWGKHVLFRVKLEYAAYVAISWAVIGAPLVGEWPGWVMIGVLVGLLIILCAQAHAWRRSGRDEPPDEATSPAPLEIHPK